MRSLPAPPAPPPLPTETVAETLTVSEWLALPAASRVAHRLTEVSLLLDIIRDELRSDESRALSWMEEDVERTFDTTNDLLQRLSC